MNGIWGVSRHASSVLIVAGVFVGCLAADVAAQTPLTWAEVRARFQANNPTLRAGQLGIDESRADEVTAYLRPNPGLSIPGFLVNVTGVPPDTGRFQNLTTSLSFDYLIERGHKRGAAPGQRPGGNDDCDVSHRRIWCAP